MSLFYNRRHRFLFNHLPKTAGSSIRGHHAGDRGLFPPIEWEGPVFLPHRIPAHWPLDRSFAILREPILRFLSGWRYCLRSWPIHQVLSLCNSPEIDHNNLKCTLGHAKHHLLPQTHPYNNLHLTTHLARFEDLPGSLWPIFTALDIKGVPPPTLPHNNSSPPFNKLELTQAQFTSLLTYLREDYQTLDYRAPETLAEFHALIAPTLTSP